jgi:hypothetical protein
MPEFGVPAYEPFLRSGRYRPETSQAVLINDGGNVALGMYTADDGDFPTQFDGMAFDEFESRVNAAVEKTA